MSFNRIVLSCRDLTVKQEGLSNWPDRSPSYSNVQCDGVDVHGVHKSLIELRRVLFDRGLNADPETLTALENLYDHAYHEGGSDEALSNADESL